MKKAIFIFVILVSALSVFLYLRLRQQRMEAQRPCGGSATIEGTQIDITSRLPTRIVAIKVRRGEAVKKGQVLVELDCREQQALMVQAQAGRDGALIAHQVAKATFALSKYGIKSAKTQVWMAYAAQKAAQAQKNALEVQKDAADRASDRVRQVHLAGVVSEQKWDQTQTQVKGLQQQLQALKENIRAAQARTSAATTAKQAAKIKKSMAQINIKGAEVKVAAAKALLSRAKVGIDECVLKAPEAGYVQERNYEPGEVVLPGSRILTLVDAREVNATFYLPNAELDAAKPGKKVEVRADAHPDKVFHGQISHVAAEAEFTPRNVQTRKDRDRLVYAVEVSIPNPKGTLRPGMPVEITIPGTSRRK